MTREEVISTPPLDLTGLVRLCHHRWTIPLVAVLGRDRGGRFAAVLRELEVARPTLERALEAADRLSLVMANPGYGHPLRPEYLLTPFGEAIAPACRVLFERARPLDGNGLVWRKWSLPVLAALRASGPRFADLQEALPAITPRALTLALDDLTEAGWVTRELHDTRPPRAHYGVRSRASALADAALALAAAAG